jgi:hypothetical protein
LKSVVAQEKSEKGLSEVLRIVERVTAILDECEDGIPIALAEFGQGVGSVLI